MVRYLAEKQRWAVAAPFLVIASALFLFLKYPPSSPMFWWAGALVFSILVHILLFRVVMTGEKTEA